MAFSDHTWLYEAAACVVLEVNQRANVPRLHDKELLIGLVRTKSLFGRVDLSIAIVSNPLSLIPNQESLSTTML
jgi:hypothetical protein